MSHKAPANHKPNTNSTEKSDIKPEDNKVTERPQIEPEQKKKKDSNIDPAMLEALYREAAENNNK